MNTINNNIEEVRVGFPNAKLLKESGFGVPCSKVFDFNGQIEEGGFREGSSWRTRTFDYNTTLNYTCSAPTQQLAIDWILKNFGIHISTYPCGMGYYCYQIYSVKKRDKPTDNIVQLDKDSIKYDELYNTPEEAKESAINYVLTKMI